MKPKKKQFFFMNIGSSSMLLIFVLLCLVSFAVLSIVSANADRNLSKKIADRTQNYYVACNEAHDRLATFNEAAVKHYGIASDETSYFRTVGRSRSETFDIAGTAQTLLVEIELLYPESEQGPFYRITTWKVIPKE